MINQSKRILETYLGREGHEEKALTTAVDILRNCKVLNSAELGEYVSDLFLFHFEVEVPAEELATFLQSSTAGPFLGRVRDLDNKLVTIFSSSAVKLCCLVCSAGGSELHVAETSVGLKLERREAHINNLAILEEG